jgi:hypothetical protein
MLKIQNDLSTLDIENTFITTTGLRLLTYILIKIP